MTGRMTDLSALLLHARDGDTAERRACTRGELVRLAPGRFVDASTWGRLRAEDRAALKALAVVPRLSVPVVVSHLSAAALWGMPLLGSGTGPVSVTDQRRARTRSGALLVRHSGEVVDAEVRAVAGLRTASPVRVAVDVALTCSASQAVAVADHGLRLDMFTREQYAECLADRARTRDRLRASWVGEFATPLAGSAGESVERVLLDALGFPEPVLQHRFTDARGLIGFTDFAWPDHGLLAEFDGLQKYVDRDLRGTATVEEVVVREKRREDRLRAVAGVRGMVRSTWRDLHDPPAFGRTFVHAGLPRVQPPRRSSPRC